MYHNFLLCGSALTTICDHWEDHNFDYTDLSRQSNASAFQHTVSVCHCFPAKKQLSSDFMAAVTVHSDFGAQERKFVTICTFIKKSKKSQFWTSLVTQRIFACQHRGHRFDSCSWRIPHALEEVSPHASTTEAHIL